MTDNFRHKVQNGEGKEQNFKIMCAVLSFENVGRNMYSFYMNIADPKYLCELQHLSKSTNKLSSLPTQKGPSVT